DEAEVAPGRRDQSVPVQVRRPLVRGVDERAVQRTRQHLRLAARERLVDVDGRTQWTPVAAAVPDPGAATTRVAARRRPRLRRAENLSSFLPVEYSGLRRRRGRADTVRW